MEKYLLKKHACCLAKKFVVRCALLVFGFIEAALAVTFLKR